MFWIPTYQECIDICEKSNGIFYETKTKVNGFDISIFNYRLATLEDFSPSGAIEMRGLTFVFNSDGTLFRTYPLLEKFFNVNENESATYELISNKEIKSVYTKEDGSIISFIQLPDGSIHAKSKNSFTSEQAILAQNIFETNKNIHMLVKLWVQSSLHPIFELVGPQNRIVLNYSTTNLILLAVRNSVGGYYDLDKLSAPCNCVRMGNIPKPQRLNHSLDELMVMKSQLENQEGWVVEFSDGQKVKIKTDWYFSVHKLYTDFSNREDYLIDFILNEKIDDLLSNLDLDSENRKFVDSVMSKTKDKYNQLSTEVNYLVSTFDGNRKDFAIQNHKNPLFSIVMKVLDGGELASNLRELILKKTYRLNEAREWLRD